MRLEATLYHHTRFTSNVTSSNPSNHRLTSSTIHYVLAKRSFLLRFHSWYGWRNQCTWPFWKYSVRHSSIQVNQEQDEPKAQFLLIEKVLALYSVFDYLRIIWFAKLLPIRSGSSDNNSTGLSILTTMVKNFDSLWFNYRIKQVFIQTYQTNHWAL